MSKMKKAKRYSGISDHRLDGGRLLTQLHKLPIKEIDWTRDFLPEHIWIDLLFNTYPQEEALELFHSLLDKLQMICPDETILHGFISDFGIVPDNRRGDFIKNNEELIFEAFFKPIGRIIAFYPEAPCYWLLQTGYLELDGSLDPEKELIRLSKSIRRLFPGKDLQAGHIRVLPFVRLIKSGKLRFPQDFVNDFKIFTEYPNNLSEDLRYFVQQLARTSIGAYIQTINYFDNKIWPKYFWRHNLDISPCIPRVIITSHQAPLDKMKVDKILNETSKYINSIIAYLDMVSRQYKYDLYNPSKDEVLLGLFSRITRLFLRFISLPELWARDIAGIFLRCLTDTTITFAYLAQYGKEEEYRAFVAYGEGKEKLLMLHLQDNHPDRTAFDGRSIDDVIEDLGGGFHIEIMNVDLGGWSKLSMREMAKLVGMEEYYRLVYDPSSSDVHGTWISLRTSNLLRCIQPLHRYHFIPGGYEPPAYSAILDVAAKMYKLSVHIGRKDMGFPEEPEIISRISYDYENSESKTEGYRK